MQRPLLLFILAVLARMSAVACDGCSRKNPRILNGLSHGTGPDTQWDYLIVMFVMALVVLTLLFSVKWLINPGEKSKDHIKNLVIKLPR